MSISPIGNSGSTPAANNSSDKLQQLEQQKKLLNQELNRLKAAKKTGATQKKMEKLKQQIKEIEVQISESKKQSSGQTQGAPASAQLAKAVGKEAATGAAATEATTADTPATKTAQKAPRVDKYIKSAENDTEQLDNTYSATKENGVQTIKFNRANAAAKRLAANLVS